MATFQELMRAAVNADAAGDEAAARELVGMARSLKSAANADAAGGEAAAREPVGMARGLGSAAIPPEMRPENQPVIPTIDAPVSEPQPDRFGDTIEKATRQPRRATAAYAAGVVDQERSPTMQNLPDWVPERFRGTAARAGDVGMTALAGLGTVYSAGAGLAGEAFGGSPTNEVKLARDLMMAGQVAIPQLAGVSGASRLASRTAQATNRLSRAPSQVQDAARAADDLGITPSLGAGGKVRAMTAGSLEAVPGVGGIISNDAARFAAEVESVFSRVNQSVGKNVGTVGAGQKLQSGLVDFTEKFKTRAESLYQKVGDKLPPNTTIQSPNTVDLIDGMVSTFARKPALLRELGMNRWLSISADLERGLSWQAATSLRSMIGESLGRMSNTTLSTLGEQKLKAVYSSLTQDLEQAARAAGRPAESAWKRATKYYRGGARRIEQDLDKLIAADSPERAIEAFIGFTKADRSTANSKRLRNIKVSVGRDAWGDISASIIDRLGKSRPGQQDAMGDAFSVNTFLTEWNKMSPEAKDLLLPATARREMTALAKVAGLGRDANLERNASKTGQTVGLMSAGAGLSSAPLTTLSMLGATAAGAKVLTNPRFLRAANKMARGDKTAMRKLADSNNQFAEDARTILQVSSAGTAGQTGAVSDNYVRPSALAQ